MLARIALVAFAFAGCRTPPYGEPSDGSADLARALDLGPPDFAERDLAVAGPTVCAATLIGANLRKSSPGCVLWESVSSGQATLRYPCAGGAAQAAFGVDTFTGTVAGGQVDLAFQTPFPWGDGCKWETHQTIRGRLASGTLAFVYEENPLAGQMGCYPPCGGTADVWVR